MEADARTYGNIKELESRRSALDTVYERERARLLGVTAQNGIYSSPVFGEGNLNPDLVLIGEAPGAEETRTGRPFVGKAGRELDELLSLAAIKREDIYITNAVKYRPVTITRTGMKNRTPSVTEVKASLKTLNDEIEILRPSIIATLGNTPLRAVMKIFGITPCVIGEAHGQAYTLHGKSINFDVLLFPLYHPASVIYNRALRPVCEAEAKSLGERVNNR